MASDFDKERRQIATQSLAKKLKLESSVENRFNRLFRKIAKDFKDLFEESGTVIRATLFSDETRRLLVSHYQTVISEFKGDILNTTKAADFPIKIKQQISELDQENARFMERQSQISESNITATTQSQLNAAIAFAFASLDADEVDISNKNVAAVASNKFISNSISRSNAIAVTETQNSSEESKFNEMNFVIGIGIASRFSSRKVWTAILDERVRDTHATADGQQRIIDENFEVQSPTSGQTQLLRHPGDSSQGASVDNVINCRCSGSLFTIS